MHPTDPFIELAKLKIREYSIMIQHLKAMVEAFERCQKIDFTGYGRQAIEEALSKGEKISKRMKAVKARGREEEAKLEAEESNPEENGPQQE